MELRDLFYATPARLKFLKTTRTEIGHAADTIKRLAMAHPEIAFSLADEEKTRFRYGASQGDLLAARLDRLSMVMGREFAENAVAVNAEREEIGLTGYAGVPTLNRGNARAQYLFVNGRPVQDRLIYGAVRGAYQDFLARNRHPMVALFLDVPTHAVDVNVHPAKAEVRFRDSGLVRGLIVGGLRHALEEAGHRGSTTVAAVGFLMLTGRIVDGEEAWEETIALPGTGSADDPFVIEELPFAHDANTAESPYSALDVYTGCEADQDESGPELVYRFTTDVPRKIRAMVIDQGEVDVDLHLLEGSVTEEACLMRAHQIIETTVPAGTYYFALDTFVANSGPKPGAYLFVLVDCDADDSACD